MPLDATRMVLNGHLIHEDVRQFVDLLTGVMTDQPVWLANDVTVGQGTNNRILHILGHLPLDNSAGDVRIQAFQDPNTGNWGPLIQGFNPSYDKTQVTLAPDPRYTYGDSGCYLRAYSEFPVTDNTMPYADFGVTTRSVSSAFIRTQQEFSVFMTTQALATEKSGDIVFDIWRDTLGGTPDASISLGLVNRSQVRINGTLDIVPYGGTPPTPFATQSNARLFVKAGDPAHVFNIDQTGTVHQFAYLTDIGGGGGIPEAPSDGKHYGRSNATWVDLGTFYQPIGNYLTQAAGDARYAQLTAADPFPQYLTQARGDARYQALGSYLTQSAADARYLQLTGGTLTGNLLAPTMNTQTLWSQSAVLGLGNTTNGSLWAVVSGALQPLTSNTQDLGATTNLVRNIYTSGTVALGHDPTAAMQAATKQYVDAAVAGAPGLTWPLLAPDGTVAAPSYSFVLSPTTGIFSPGTNRLQISTSGSARWEVNATGHLLAASDNTSDIGANGANRPANLWLAGNARALGTCFIGGSTTNNTVFSVSQSTAITSSSQNIIWGMPFFPSTTTGSGMVLRARVRTTAAAFTMAAGFGLYIDPVAPLGTGSAVTTIYGVNVGNQGAAGVTNAYGVYIANQSGASTTNIGLYNLGTTTLDGVVTATASILAQGGIEVSSLGTSSSTDLIFKTSNVQNWKIINAGHLWTVTDNAYDIGASGANRPRDVFIARNLQAAGSVTAAGINLPDGAISTAFIAANAVTQNLFFSGALTWSTTAAATWVATNLTANFGSTNSGPIRIEITASIQHSVANAVYFFGIGVDSVNGNPYWLNTAPSVADAAHVVTGVGYLASLPYGAHTITLVFYMYTPGTLAFAPGSHQSISVTEQKR